MRRKRHKKKLLIFLCAGASALALLAAFVLAIKSSHYPYVAAFEGELLIYGNEPYIPVDEQDVKEIIGTEIVLGQVLGEIKLNLGFWDYVVSNHPIQAIVGDDDLNFIAQPMWQSPAIFYCRKAFCETLCIE